MSGDDNSSSTPDSKNDTAQNEDITNDSNTTSTSSSESAGSGRSSPSEEVRVLRATLEETRPTLDTIEGFLSDIDDKAGRTLRLNIGLIGLLLTVVSLGFSQDVPGVSRLINPAFFTGIAASSISILAALLTYTRSTVTVGLGGEDITYILNNDVSEEFLLRSLVRSHRTWIQENGRVNERDARTLFTSHLFLLLSMGYYGFAVVWAYIRPVPQSVILYTSLIALTAILTFVIYLPQSDWV